MNIIDTQTPNFRPQAPNPKPEISSQWHIENIQKTLNLLTMAYRVRRFSLKKHTAKHGHPDRKKDTVLPGQLSPTSPRAMP